MAHKFLISGGGTGGHIFPAIAIANQLKEMHPDAQFLFVGARGKMEMEKVPAAGYEIIGLNITGIQRSLSLSNLVFPFRLLGSLIKARSILKRFGPDAVVGVGGFASGPILRMATWMKIPTLIQEQNSFAGITNRWVASSVQSVCVAYEGMEKFFPADRIHLTGNPVRKEVVSIEGRREEALAKYKFTPEKPVLLVVGGSLGARSINRAMKEGVKDLLSKGVQVIWQTGKLFKEESAEVQAQYENQPLHLTDFIYKMDEAYAAADVVISRAGAIAVSELCIIGKPAVLVPFPFAAEDHQTKNAQALVENDAALMVKDSQVQEKLIAVVQQVMDDEETRAKLSKNILTHARPNATQDIANEVIRLTK